LRLATNYLPPENYLSARDQLSADEEEWRESLRARLCRSYYVADGKPGSKVDYATNGIGKESERELRRA
jgi:hypothetical protein